MRRGASPIVLAAPVRTPIGKFGGALASLSAADLAVAAAVACLERSGLAADAVDQVIFGHARQAGGGPNVARQVAHRAGIPAERPAFTVNQACGSGLQAIFCAARSVLLGEAGVVLAGGTESMSNTPYMVPAARWGQRLGHGELVDGMYRDGFNDPLSGMIMGETAEVLARRYRIDRGAADAYAAASQQRYEAARERGRFTAEIAPLEVPGRSGTVTMRDDEHPRSGVTAEALSRLSPVFEEGGTVTAGNASGITDGSAALLVTTEECAAELGLETSGRLLDWAVVGVEPEIMGIGPVPAVDKLLARGPVTAAEVELVELNEAFATQVLACLPDLPFASEIVNRDGGAIAIGHPIGCTGARILVTLLHGLVAHDARRGVATLCVSGGMGLAALVERTDS